MVGMKLHCRSSKLNLMNKSAFGKTEKEVCVVHFNEDSGSSLHYYYRRLSSELVEVIDVSSRETEEAIIAAEEATNSSNLARETASREISELQQQMERQGGANAKVVLESRVFS